MQAGKLSLSFVAVGSFSCATILSVHASKNFRCAAGLVEKISIDDDAKKQSTTLQTENSQSAAAWDDVTTIRPLETRA
jgi:hypothetical protein